MRWKYWKYDRFSAMLKPCNSLQSCRTSHDYYLAVRKCSNRRSPLLQHAETTTGFLAGSRCSYLVSSINHDSLFISHLGKPWTKDKMWHIPMDHLPKLQTMATKTLKDTVANMQLPSPLTSPTFACFSEGKALIQTSSDCSLKCGGIYCGSASEINSKHDSWPS